MKIQLPFWMSNGALNQLRLMAIMYWELVRIWISKTPVSFDPLTCSEEVLELIAWERSVKRMNGEPLDLFRKRVFYAAQNAVDGGSVAGFYRIFERLGITLNYQIERAPLHDWDIVQLEVGAKDLTLAPIIEAVAVSYGRTCRRYTVAVNTTDSLDIRLIPTSYEKQTIKIIT